MITIVNFDAHGNFWRETRCMNDALLKLLRFARQHPQSLCSIQLRDVPQSVTAHLPRLERADQDIRTRDLLAESDSQHAQGNRE
jgi:hypothetical protein